MTDENKTPLLHPAAEVPRQCIREYVAENSGSAERLGRKTPEAL
ncbi:MAG: hypothetical protein PHT19_07985 [Methylococcus sp.]|nr:hypothetical protein [Methylococcus sp.]